MTPDRRRLGTVALLLVLAVLGGCTGENPQTEVVCENCVSGMNESGRALNASVTVEESVTDVYLRRSGNALVEARMRLSGSGVDKLRDNERLVDGFMSVVGDERLDGTRPAFDRQNLTGRMDGNEFVVTFRVDDVSDQRIGGTTLSSYFFRQDGEGRSSETRFDEPHRIETDRLVVHGPEGTEPLVQPPGATVDEDRLVWDGDSVSTRSYVVFGGGPAGPLVGRAVVAMDVLSWGVAPAFWGAIVPAILLGFLAWVLLVRYRSFVGGSGAWSPRTDRVFWALFALAGTAVAGVGGGLFESLYGAIAMVVTFAAILATWWWQRPDADDRADAATDDVAGDGTDDLASHVSDDVASGGTDDPVGSGDEAADSWPGPSRRTLLSGVLPVVGVVVLSALVAADYGTAVAPFVARGAGLIPLVTFPALGHLVARPDRTHVAGSLVVLTAVCPWLVSFPWVVARGAHGGPPAVTTFVWTVGVVFAGSSLFYVAVWRATR